MKPCFSIMELHLYHFIWPRIILRIYIRLDAGDSYGNSTFLYRSTLSRLKYKMGNQAIISGTADYSFKHFAQYWRRYRDIIESKGDPRKLDEWVKNQGS